MQMLLLGPLAVTSLDLLWLISHTPSRSPAHLELHKKEDLLWLGGCPWRVVDIGKA